MSVSASSVRKQSPVIAIVGATGAVGAELVTCLEQRQFPLSDLRLLASARSAGKVLQFGGRDVVVRELDERSFDGVDIALFSAGGTQSKRFAPVAVDAGAVVIDNSSAFRMVETIPLVVPEVNASALTGHPGIIANPNCVAIVAAVPLWPLHQHNPIHRITIATYQAASGAGAAAMEELRESTRAFLDDRAYSPKVLPHPYAFNVFSHNSQVDMGNGYNDEEMKVMQELKKLFAQPALRVTATCIRVPVLRAHSMAINVEFTRPMSPEVARELLQSAPGVRVVDDRTANYFPMPLDATGKDEVLVGRIRTDVSDPSGHSLLLFAAGDQLRKGAALNAVQIAERLLSKAP